MGKSTKGVSPEERRQGIEWVDRYLTLCEKRELDAAAEYLADDAKLLFPGGFRYSRLSDMVADAQRRYRHVKKHKTHFDVYYDEDDHLVVVSRGTLEGESLSGRRFSGVRFQDRFVFANGKIIDQQVWNDLGATGVLDPLAHLMALNSENTDARTD